jgi:hypothetical protein
MDLGRGRRIVKDAYGEATKISSSHISGWQQEHGALDLLLRTGTDSRGAVAAPRTGTEK